MYRHRQIGRQGPGSRRPNEQIFILRILEFQPHIDRLILSLSILHLRLGQGRSATCAPVNGPQSLIDHSLFHQLSQHTQFCGLVGGTHRQVWMIPIPKNSKPLKLLLLTLDEVPSHLLTLGADDGRIGSHELLLGHDLVFDGQAVTVPSRYKRCI